MKKKILGAAVYIGIIGAVLVLSYIGSSTATVMAENRIPDRGRCIVIDPGHGGEDGGAVSCSGRTESTYNLEISLRLRDLLHFLGYETRMTRSADVSIYTGGETIAQKKMSDLKERVRLINETEDPLLLSIHQNHFTDGRYSGAQVFYAKTEGSRELAAQLQTALVASVNPGSNRKSKSADGIYLMEHIRCTGVLIECGFLSNAEEEARLRTEAYQKKLCCVIAATVIQYLSDA